MFGHQSTSTTSLPFNLGLRESSSSETSNRPRSPIYTLNDDVLLTIFNLCRPPKPDEYGDGKCGLSPTRNWFRQRWWYRLVHICRLWRSIIFASPFRLDLNLVCTRGVPVADMLAHSPPLPLTIFFHDRDYVPVEILRHEADILLALSHRDRVRRIGIWTPSAGLGKLVKAMDGRFPILERMYFHSQTEEAFPTTFQAPNLLHFSLATSYPPIESLLITSAAGLVNLKLLSIPTSAYCCFLSRLPLLLRLEMLSITSEYPRNPHLASDAETQFLRTLDIFQVTLTYLRRILFEGTCACLEGLVSRINAPALRNFDVYLFNQPPFQVTVPRLSQFMQSSQYAKFNTAGLHFEDSGIMIRLFNQSLRRQTVHWNPNPPVYYYHMACKPLNSQVASMAKILDALSPILSVVGKVVLSSAYIPPNHHNKRTQWRNLLRPFNNAKALHVHGDLIEQVSEALQSKDGESPLELLPNLKDIVYSGGPDSWHLLSLFINERQGAGYTVDLNPVNKMWWFC